MDLNNMEKLAYLLIGFSISGIYFEIVQGSEIKKLRKAVEKFVDWAVSEKK